MTLYDFKGCLEYGGKVSKWFLFYIVIWCMYTMGTFFLFFFSSINTHNSHTHANIPNLLLWKPYHCATDILTLKKTNSLNRPFENIWIQTLLEFKLIRIWLLKKKFRFICLHKIKLLSIHRKIFWKWAKIREIGGKDLSMDTILSLF